MIVNIVTGGCGFIGSHLVDKLVESKQRVVVVDDMSVGRLSNLSHIKNNDLLEIIQGNVSDKELMRKVIEPGSRVFHLAALADIVPSVQNPTKYFDSNVSGTMSVLEACREKTVSKLVYVASSSCYGVPDVYPTPENEIISPQYPYALTKWMGEELVLHWSKLYDIPSISLRFFNIYGPRARTSGTYGAVFGVFLAQMLAGLPVTIVGDGKQTRDFTYVSDAVDALIVAAKSDVSGEVFNVGSDNPVSINRLVELLKAKDKCFIPKRPGEPDCTFADTEKIKKMLGWKASVPIEKGVELMLRNIHYWDDAPVWTPDLIQEATEDWFKYLGQP